MTLQNQKGGITIQNKLPPSLTSPPYPPPLSSIPTPDHDNNSDTILTQQVHSLMYMLCSCYVDGMFVSIGKDREETRKGIVLS